MKATFEFPQGKFTEPSVLLRLNCGMYFIKFVSHFLLVGLRVRFLGTFRFDYDYDFLETFRFY